jgi:hypothetical protein
MIATRSLSAALGAAVVLLGAGCSAVDSVTGDRAPASPSPSDNGVADRAPGEILLAAKNALHHAGSVHLRGNGAAGGEVYAIDMRIKGAQAGKGTITIKHNPVEILRIGKKVYVKGDADFYLAMTGSKAAAELLKGKYLTAGPTDPNLKGLANFTDAGALADELLDSDGAVTKGETRTVAGIPTIGITFTSGDDKVVAYVATTGKPYPMMLQTVSKTADAGEIDFTEYDKPLLIKPPPADLVVDTSKLGK